MSQCLASMPYEVMWIIIAHLGFDDIINLGRTCRKMYYIQNDERICRSISERWIPFSKEAISTKSKGGFARVVRRVAKRRDALVNAQPYSAVIVGFGESYIYSSGVLCYLLGAEIRVLPLHDSGEEEVIISISGLMQELVPEEQRVQKPRLQFLNYNEGVLCFLLEILDLETDAEPWIIALDIETGALLLKKRLTVTEKLFVRHDRNYLFYGTHSERDIHHNKRWVVRGYRFLEQSWFEECVHLSDMVGSDIGSTVCFELHNGFFYALSSETSDEPEEVDWTSFYHCFRFPLDSPSNELLESTDNNRMWRRQHSEGPIDDRWTSLRLECDEATNDVRIVEARREWPMGGSRSRRTYYLTSIEFPDKTASGNSNPAKPWSSRINLSDLPNDQLLATLTSSDNPHYLKPTPRLPQNVHLGDDDYSRSAFVLNKTKVRHYNVPANASLDLVDDPVPDDWQAKQRLKLRVGARKPRPLQPLTERNSNSLPKAESEPTAYQPADTMFQYNSIKMWPPERPEFDEIHTLLNPPTHLGNVYGTADERSLIYCTGGDSNQPAALVFINFDPSIKLPGLKIWLNPGVGEGPHIDGRATGRQVMSIENSNDKQNYKGKGKELPNTTESITEPPHATHVAINEFNDHQESGDVQDEKTGKRTNWLWVEPALYKSIDRGFWFGIN